MMRQRTRASPWGNTPYLNVGGRLKRRTGVVNGYFGLRPSEKRIFAVPKLRFQTAF
ncbi:hypothetical protein HMPREF9123_0650 [Neisseria bacilliformis ATCC BAA-1200]|uniref:Uncharacterized protein n=1 Tax=Neisseria bacilliformis ATCC BAA-1200 TaxID=888742 RepID=F2BAH8_9NEIS|nr:hypothetical protein HMPREF9123_0650 [Neisseria bacilliformis ATCC BAA-1200]